MARHWGRQLLWLCFIISITSLCTYVIFVDNFHYPVDFEVDVVMTWVDPANKEWHDQFVKFAREEGIEVDMERIPASFEQPGAKDELYLALTSILTNMPWVRQIHLVTQRPQQPSYLNELRKKTSIPINIVHHDQYIPKKYLPNFQPYLLELFFDAIPGLAERFVYFNDDMYVLKPMSKSAFFTPDGRAIAPVLFPGFAMNKYKCWMGNNFQCLMSYMQDLFNVRVWYSRYHVAYASTRTSYRDFRALAGPKEVDKLGLHKHRTKTGLNYNFGSVNINHPDIDVRIFNIPYKFCFIKRTKNLHQFEKDVRVCDLLCLNVLSPETPANQRAFIFKTLEATIRGEN